jgi:ATP-dependent Clp protease ATP-binding subunit ClpC
MFERFTTEARRTVVLAQEEARKLNHSRISCEHLLLSILAEDSLTTRHLEGYLLDYRSVKAEVLKANPNGEVPLQGHIPFTSTTKAVFNKAFNLALEFSPTSVGVEHLAVALLDTTHPVLDAIFSELEVSKDLPREDLCDSIIEIASARQAIRVTSPRGEAAQSTSHAALAELLESDFIPRRNLVEALMTSVRNADDKTADDIIAILKK